jgi:hypothetical protein
VRRNTITIAALLALALPLAGASAATGLFGSLVASARTQRGSFHGTLTVRSFKLERRALVAASVLTGTLHDTRYPADVRVRQPATLGVRVSGRNCSATVAIRGRAFVWGLPATLAAQRVKVGGAAGCKLTSARNPKAQAQALERLRRSRG